MWLAMFEEGCLCFLHAAKSLQSCPILCDPIDGSHQAPASLGFSRQEHWSGVPLPSPVSCIELHLKAPEPAMMGALTLAVRAYCWMWAHAGGAARWGPRLGSISWSLMVPAASSGSFTDVLSPLLCVRLCCFRTGTGRGVMREAMALSKKEIGLGRESDLDLKLGSFTFSFLKKFF